MQEKGNVHTHHGELFFFFSLLEFSSSSFFLHQGGRDANQTIQKLGRGLRKAEDKRSVEYHDFILRNNSILEQHSQARMNTLRQEGHPITTEPHVLS